MKLKFESKKEKTNEVCYTFEVDINALNQAKDLAYEKEYKAEFEAKGFRKGQAPRSAFERAKGYQVMQQAAIDELIQHAFELALKDKKYQIVGHPEVDIDQKLFIDLIVAPFKFKLLLPVKPEVILGEYKNIEVQTKKVKVQDKEIKEKIDAELSKGITLKLKKEGSKLEKDNIAIFDFEGFKDGKPFAGGKAENYSLKIGSGQFIPGFEDQMIGMSQGETKELKLAFPDNYGEKTLAGKKVTFKVLLHEIKEEVKPKLDEEFIKTLKIKNVKTVEEYKQNVKDTILSLKEKEEKIKVSEEILNKVIKNSKIDIHPGMIKYECLIREEEDKQRAKQYQINFEDYLKYLNMSHEDYHKKLEKEAKENLTKMLVAEKIIEVEKIKATESEIEKEYEKIAKVNNLSVNDIKKQVKPEQIENQIKTLKFYDKLYKEAKIITKE